MADPEGAVIIFGRGADLGDLSVFAQTLANDLKPTYKSNIIIKNIENREDFFKFLKEKKPFKVKELHIFSHSIGAGLYIGYKSTEASNSRNTAFNAATAAGRKISYGEVVKAETGAILTDILSDPDIVKDRDTLRAMFAPNALMKFWGCNAGVKGWVYSDERSDGSPVTDQADTTASYYWRALNLQKVPKPSISQAFADFFNVTVFGAMSGSDVRVLTGGKWITSEAYKKANGHWPSGRLPQRLQPDRGTYNEFKPASAAPASTAP